VGHLVQPSCRSRVNLELNLATDVKDDKKGFLKYISSEWKTRDNVGLLLNEVGAGPVQPAVGDAASAGGLDRMTHRGPFQPRTFWNSMWRNFLILILQETSPHVST